MKKILILNEELFEQRRDKIAVTLLARDAEWLRQQKPLLYPCVWVLDLESHTETFHEVYGSEFVYQHDFLHN